MRYYLDGTNRTIVNTITETVVEVLCCADKYPNIQRDMDAFLERMNKVISDEKTLNSSGGRRLAHYYSFVLKYKQRGWKKVADKPIDAEVIKKNIIKQFDHSDELPKRLKQRRTGKRVVRGGKVVFRKLSFRRRRKAQAKRSLHL